MSHDLPNHDGRIEVIRDRDRNRCQNCHKTKGEASRLEVHQIIAGDRGGTDRLSNFTLLCRRCHSRADGPETAEAA